MIGNKKENRDDLLASEEWIKISKNGQVKEVKPPSYGMVTIKYQDGKPISVEKNEREKI